MLTLQSISNNIFEISACLKYGQYWNSGAMFVDGDVIPFDSAEFPKKGDKRVVELQKHSVERWRERIKSDSDLQCLDGMRCLQKDFPTKQILPKTRTVDIGKGLDHFYSRSPIVSAPSKLLQIDLNEFEDITTTTPSKLSKRIKTE
ncbi:hypothetical protein LOAG_11392 [Loa loa]|uniref:Uncharacterized protein n=1 Tax=Loa loa TaxID=7209 RepID=A0A1S0TP96_LOALO|nr:hypothetical protein LOAG_11392 [Loa loa]EFO17110.1 hypothetical protein LOAG_11392 [Loa loa]